MSTKIHLSMKNFVYTALLLIFAATCANAQPIREMQRSKKVEYAEKAYLEGNTSKAEEIYQEIYSDDKAKGVTDLSIMSRIADLLNFSLRDYKAAEKWYGNLAKADKNGEYPITKFSLGRVLKKGISLWKEKIGLVLDGSLGVRHDKRAWLLILMRLHDG